MTPLDTLLYHSFGPGFRTMLKDPTAAFPSEADELTILRNNTTLQTLNKTTTAGAQAGEEVTDVEG